MAKYPISVTIKKTPLKAAAPKVAAPKPKPMPAPKPNKAATQATLNRAARVQGEEAKESLLMRRRPAAKDTISVVTRMRETPAKKK